LSATRLYISGGRKKILDTNDFKLCGLERKILIRDRLDNETKVIEIGKFIDSLLEENKEKVLRIGDNTKEEMGNIHYLDTKIKNYTYLL
jgi:hypothetical protein